MLVQAMNNFQMAKREHKENVKAQYTDKGSVKNYFRASELGSSDRKILYGFFAHQITRNPKGAQNLRQLENGDYVHERYQKAWEEMGVLLSMEERVSSKNDEYLKQFPWEWAGHYDGELDLNILRAHALGFAKVNSTKNEETDQWEIEVELDEAYANSIGLFDENGEISADYQPRSMVADIKTMNPWGFKRIKEKGDVSEIAGYLDQISFYMYMLNTPYGSIYIEAKDNNDVVEVQVVWKDLHEGVEYTFDPDIHGEQSNDQVRVVIDSGRFFGDETREGVVPRVSRLWGMVEELRKADAEGDSAKVAEILAQTKPCGESPDKFPCSWGHKTGNIQYCEFFDHCWKSQHKGLAVRDFEECPVECVWSFKDEHDEEVKIDSRKVPNGVTEDAFLALVEAGVLDYTTFVVASAPTTCQLEDDVTPAEETAMSASTELFDTNGVLNLGAPEAPKEAEEYLNEENKKAIHCVNCGQEVTYQKLGNGGTKKCTFCSHINKVVKL